MTADRAEAPPASLDRWLFAIQLKRHHARCNDRVSTKRWKQSLEQPSSS